LPGAPPASTPWSTGIAGLLRPVTNYQRTAALLVNLAAYLLALCLVSLAAPVRAENLVYGSGQQGAVGYSAVMITGRGVLLSTMSGTQCKRPSESAQLAGA
jgi:hypothetical protein